MLFHSLFNDMRMVLLLFLYVLFHLRHQLKLVVGISKVLIDADWIEHTLDVKKEYRHFVKHRAAKFKGLRVNYHYLSLKQPRNDV